MLDIQYPPHQQSVYPTYFDKSKFSITEEGLDYPIYSDAMLLKTEFSEGSNIKTCAYSHSQWEFGDPLAEHAKFLIMQAAPYAGDENLEDYATMEPSE